MIVLKDFLPKTYIDEIRETFLCRDFGWFYKKGTSYNADMKGWFGNSVIIDNNTQDSPQFVHEFFTNDAPRCNFFPLVKTMLYFLEKEGYKTKGIYRIKSNLMTQESNYPKNMYNIPHVDIPQRLAGKNNFWTFLYYVDDSDGDTIFFNEKLEYEDHFVDKLTNHGKTSPIGGTGVLFESSRFHASTPPSYNKTRMVINYVLELE